MNKIKIGYFYTKDTPYKKIGEDYLQKSLEKFSIKCLVTETDNHGDWKRNVAEKPKVILDQLEQIEENECLVFLDADCTVEKWPKLFEEIPKDYDIAYHSLSWKQWYGYAVETLELLTGTMFFRNKQIVKDLCTVWYERAVKTNIWEQKVLQQVLTESYSTLGRVKAYPLPLSYCYMNSRPGGVDPLYKLEEPYIIHYQKSRELKKVGGRI